MAQKNPAQEFVVITGSSSGIGRACAQLFSSKGYGVILSGRNRHALESLSETLPTESHILCGDLSSSQTIEAARTLGTSLNLVGLVNSAGIFVRKTFEESS